MVDHSGRTVRAPFACPDKQVGSCEREQLSMLIRYTACERLTLPFWTDEGGVDQDEPGKHRCGQAGDQGSGQASHRMAEQNWRIQLQLFNQADDIGGERGIGVAASRSAGLSMTACIWKDPSSQSRLRACWPAAQAPLPSRPCKATSGRLISACSQKVDVDAIRFRHLPLAQFASDVCPGMALIIFASPIHMRRGPNEKFVQLLELLAVDALSQYRPGLSERARDGSPAPSAPPPSHR